VSAGPSTSFKGDKVVPASPVLLSKSDLLDRLKRRASNRYGAVIDGPWLADLIKDGLVSKAKRIGNQGQKPIFAHDARDYRRALQIARLQGLGLVGRDAIRINLFINGYGLPSWDVREALLREWPKHGKALLAQIRSGYLDNDRAIPPNHRESLVAQLGPLDDRIAAAGFVIGADLFIEGLRGAVQQPIASAPFGAPGALMGMIERADFDVARLAKAFIPEVAGMLMFGLADDGAKKSPDYFEGLISAATDADLEKARGLAFMMQRHIAPLFLALGICPDQRSAVGLDNAIHNSVQRSAAWASIMLFAAVMLARRFPEIPSAQQSEEIKCAIESVNLDKTRLDHSEAEIVSLISAIAIK
jgi:hypothetical protein